MCYIHKRCPHYVTIILSFRLQMFNRYKISSYSYRNHQRKATLRRLLARAEVRSESPEEVNDTEQAANVPEEIELNVQSTEQGGKKHKVWTDYRKKPYYDFTFTV